MICQNKKKELHSLHKPDHLKGWESTDNSAAKIVNLEITLT